MFVEIDPNAGFCFGVVNAIKTAEKNLDSGEKINCLGQIVHNEMENNRLHQLGMKTISHDDLAKLNGVPVLISAHGEPPSTYKIAKENNIKLIDATCPVVLKLQEKVRKAWERLQASGGTVIIYGKKGHAEVVGLSGQTDNKAIVVEGIKDLDGIDFSKPVEIFSQTTKESENYQKIINEIRARMAKCHTNPDTFLKVNNTICGQVANRKPKIKEFAKKHDVIVFVSGKNSSNGKMLFEVCREVNPQSHIVSNSNEINSTWFANAASVGVSGATSTPTWLMAEVADAIKAITNKK
ncbi:MAG: 4-hydroxy-3-methylbut-2-en-yl diphosphate reductase [Tenuifilum sp.]|jgi:4-hydroxy-3-methylbut-2-enyl diphosphate reductase|uniref:4-hydroxy-3-methylbut-2-enyl diphosphate reductase n=1 Tax=Tenuifilum sp. TaxID=2760880 RepID=UPI0024AAA27B|nr:4-hydroxy-3-methylbut-2-enyl diphosphate reductase [Tenuifilum sp.]MDI3528035.1 4-hydroxy-3-methylbut-2-en-yl diphosphate reductase [Tenuifilum sp.]